MTDWSLEQINLLDTDYADILASSSHPSFELQLAGINHQKPASKPISSLWYAKNLRLPNNELL